MTTPLDVANIALARLAARSISALTEGSVEARAVNRLFAPVRDLMLAARDWRFATARFTLDATGVTPVFPFPFGYRRPTNCIKPRYIVPTADGENGLHNDDRVPFEEGVGPITGTSDYGAIILTSIQPATLVYTYRVENPDLWEPGFLSAMSMQLAAEIALPITGNAQVASAMAKAASDAVLALKPDGMNEGVSQQQRGSETTNARGG